MILKTYARLFVRSLDDAMPFLEKLVGRPADLRFMSDDPKLLASIAGAETRSFHGSWEVEQAAIGDFLVIAGADEALDVARTAAGPVIVDDLRMTTEQLIAAGAVVVVPQTMTETGSFNYLRHPDGNLIEYVEWTPDLVARIIG